MTPNSNFIFRKREKKAKSEEIPLSFVDGFVFFFFLLFIHLFLFFSMFCVAFVYVSGFLLFKSNIFHELRFFFSFHLPFALFRLCDNAVRMLDFMGNA